MGILVSDRTFAHLEWDRLRQALASRCSGSVARERALELRPMEDPEALAGRLARVTAARRLLDDRREMPVGEVFDVRQAIALAARGARLEAADLHGIGGVLAASARVAVFLRGLDGTLAALGNVAAGLVELPDLAATIARSVDARGEVLDGASPELADLRRRVSGLRDELEQHVVELVNGPQYADVLQDRFFTVRDGRYVLPIRAASEGRVDGIVHGFSGSGQTVFIEPGSVVAANNRLRLCQADVEREIYRILTRLSAEVGGRAAEILRSLETLAELDLVRAAARLSAALGAVEPRIADPQALDLVEARHPLLVLEGTEVVANRIALCEGQRVLVVTGPNTGGKTVVLKTAGLTVLMALSGLHVPVRADSRIPRVPAIFTDIGDEQSLERHLSTFSGHVASLLGIFSEVRPGCLVLLDELAVGTDPVQGAALAQAVLEAFASRGAVVLVTTHYESLKALPLADGRFRNGAMGVESGTGMPTWRLVLDVPGSSSALSTARRLGLDGAIVDRAEALAGAGRSDLEIAIRKLEDEATEIGALKRSVAEAERRLEAERRGVAAKEEELRTRLRAGVRNERDALLEEARRLRTEVRDLQEALRSEAVRRDADRLAGASRRLESIITDAAAQERAEEREGKGGALEPAELVPGRTVHVLGLDRDAEIVRAPDGRGRVLVRAGAFSLEVPLGELARAGSTAAAPAAPPEPAKAQRLPERADMAPLVSPSRENTVDVRGLRVEEAVESVRGFLDTETRRGSDVVFIIHGHGTGALKSEIRRFLRSSGYARQFRPAEQDKGGDGVTVVWLRA